MSVRVRFPSGALRIPLGYCSEGDFFPKFADIAQFDQFVKT